MAGENLEIAALAQIVDRFASLPLEELDQRKWEALIIVSAVLNSATKEGAAKAHADKDARFSEQIAAEGILARFHPKWLLRTDDGQPPALRHALASAFDNPSRNLHTRLQALLVLPEEEREPLADVARALIADAYRGAKGYARDAFIRDARGANKDWHKDPWFVVLSRDGAPPLVSYLIEHQGETHDGGWHDDPSDDTAWEKVRFGLHDAVRTWDVNWLRDNPMSDLYVGVTSTAETVVDRAGDVAGGLDEAAKGLATLIKWTPVVVGGVAVIGLTVYAVTRARRAAS